jgi:hypothetical protein
MAAIRQIRQILKAVNLRESGQGLDNILEPFFFLRDVPKRRRSAPNNPIADNHMANNHAPSDLMASDSLDFDRLANRRVALNHASRVNRLNQRIWP